MSGPEADGRDIYCRITDFTRGWQKCTITILGIDPNYAKRPSTGAVLFQRDRQFSTRRIECTIGIEIGFLCVA